MIDAILKGLIEKHSDKALRWVFHRLYGALKGEALYLAHRGEFGAWIEANTSEIIAAELSKIGKRP